MSQIRGKLSIMEIGKRNNASKPSVKEQIEMEAEEKKHREDAAAALAIINSEKIGWIYPEPKKKLPKPVVEYPKLIISEAALFIKQFATVTKARVARTLEYNKCSVEQLATYIGHNPGDLDAYACYALLTDNITVLDVERLDAVKDYLVKAENLQVAASIEFIRLHLNQEKKINLNELLKEDKFSTCYLNLSGILFGRVLLQENDINKAIDLSFANLANTYFCTTNGTGASLFDRVNFHGARLCGTNLNDATFNYCDFEAADLRGCSVTNAAFTDTSFRRANLTSVDLSNVKYNHVSFSRAILINAKTRQFKQEDRVHLGDAILVDLSQKLTVAELLKKISKWRSFHVPNSVIYYNLSKLLSNKELRYSLQEKKDVLVELQKLFTKISEQDVKTFDMRLFHAGNCYLEIEKKLIKIEVQLSEKSKCKGKNIK